MNIADTLESVHVWLERAFRIATGSAFAVLIVAVTVQVAGRSFVGASPVWTEELTRFALLYLAACGTGLALGSGDLVDVDILRSAMPARVARAMRLLALTATAALCASLLPAAWLYTSIGARQTSPALGWRMDWLHGSMFVLLAALGLFALMSMMRMFYGTDGNTPADTPTHTPVHTPVHDENPELEAVIPAHSPR